MGTVGSEKIQVFGAEWVNTQTEKQLFLLGAIHYFFSAATTEVLLPVYGFVAFLVIIFSKMNRNWVYLVNRIE